MTGQIRKAYGTFLDEVFANVRTVISTAPDIVKPILKYHLQMLEKSKGYRPAFVLACAVAANHHIDRQTLVNRASVVQLLHETTLLIDDILDRSRYRRGQITAHCRFGTVHAFSAAMWLKDMATYLERGNPEIVASICQCTFELVEAEAFQWTARLRPRPTEMEDWLRIASGDTGSLFRLAAVLGDFDAQSDAVESIYLVYHGLDDLHDLFEVDALGGGGHADLRDRIPTLPSCFTTGYSRSQLRDTLPKCIGMLRSILDKGISVGGSEFCAFFCDLKDLIDLVETRSRFLNQTGVTAASPALSHPSLSDGPPI